MLYWDEDRQEWVEDDTAEPQQPSELPEVIYQSPDFEEDQTPVPPPPPGYRSDIVRGGIPVGSIEGTLPDKYRARQMAREEIAAEQNRYNVPPGDSIDATEERPADPHLDSDVIHYPNEVHTKNKEGGWDVAQRNIPQKPDETKMTEFELLKYVREKPEYKQAVADAVKNYESKFEYSELSLLKGSQKIAHQRDVAQAARAEAQRIENAVLNEHRAARRAAEEASRNEREKKEEQDRYARSLSDRERQAAEKAADKRESDEEKRADRLAKETAARELKNATKISEIATVRKAVAEATWDDIKNEPKDPNPNTVEALKDMANKAGYDFVNVKGTKPGKIYGTNPTSEWKLVLKGGSPSQDSAPDKTVTIDGAQYKDGDVVIQNGKKFRVKVKK